MAGYSGTPLFQKLGIKLGAAVLLVSAPQGLLETLGPLPEGAEIVRATTKRRIDVALVFATTKKALQKQFAKVASRLQPAGGLWICWPKKASGKKSELMENLIREIGLEAGLVDNKVCAIDDTWSGLRFVIRLVDRPQRSLRSVTINP